MFKQENKIIIVDDNQEHLDILSKPFQTNGIGCKCFKYDVDYHSPLQNIRVAFFDIYINPSGGGSNSQRLNDIPTAIMQYIDPNNGPFALIFWTSHKDNIAAIKNYIQERYPDCPKPFLVDFIDKDEFLLAENINNLPIKLETILGDETLKILFEFENVSSQSASKTINQLYEIIPTNDTWGETVSFKENFEKVFSKIAVQNLGYKHAKENPDKGVISSLLPILNHHIESSHKSEKWKNYLVTLRNSNTQGEITYPENFCEDKLNSIFHIHLSENIDKDERGVVVLVDSTDAPFQTNFGLQYSTWFSMLLPGVTRANREISRLIAIEISASCDYSQKKPRLNKYMLGVLLPENAVSEIEKNIPQYLMLLDGVFSTESKFKICLNLNFVFSAFKNDAKLGEPLFILKKEIMDQIGNRYANHVSRIGITSF